ncbi:MAG: exosortase/archaeosortase family protein [Opitutaceae bacterium]
MFYWLMGCTLAGMALVVLSAAWSLAPDLGHGWAAVILIGFLWWDRWDRRPPCKPRQPGAADWLVLMAGALLALPLRLLLTPYPLWPAPLLAYLAVLIGLALCAARMVAGRSGMIWLAAPLIVLAGVVPWPGAIDRWFILPLRETVAIIVAEISNIAGNPAVASGTSVQLPGGWVGIDEACGGIRSMQATVTAALFLGAWLDFTWRRRLGLLAIGVGAAVAGNFVRVLFLSWMASGHADDLETWHDPAGWLALGISLGVTGGAAWVWRKAARTPSSPPPGRTPRPVTVASRSGLVWSILLVLLLLSVEAGTRLWYTQGSSRVRAQVPRWQAHFPEETITYQILPLSDSAHEMLRPDRFESGSWIGADQLRRSAYYIEWERGQVARSVPFLHNPTVCLPYAGCELQQDLGVVEVAWAGRVIPFYTYLFRQRNEDLLVAFTIWDPARGAPLENVAEGWWSWWQRQWRDVREAQAHQPAQLIAYAVARPGPDHPLQAELAGLLVAAKP